MLLGQFIDGMENSIADSGTLQKAKRELSIFASKSDAKQLAYTYKAIGNYYYSNGNGDSTLHYYKNALELFKSLKDSFNLYYCYFRFGERAYFEGNSYHTALNWHLPAADFFSKTKYYRMAAHSHFAVSTTYAKLNEAKLAGGYMNKAKLYIKLAKDTVLEMIILTQQAQAWLSQNTNLKKVIEYSTQTVLLGEKSKNFDQLKIAYNNLANATIKSGNPYGALKYLNKSAEIKCRALAEYPKTYQLYAVAYLHMGNLAEAEKYITRFKDVSDSINKEKEKDNFRELMIKYEAKKKQEVILNLEKDNNLKAKLDKQQKTIIAGLTTGLAVLVIGSYFFYRNFLRRQKLEKQLQEQASEFKEQLQFEKEQKMTAEFNSQISEVQLIALNAQMNPHFIFNCMNSIQKYVLQNEKSKAIDFLQNFSELMRFVLDNSSKNKVGLDEEINMLEKYIQLEQQRMDFIFDYDVTVMPDVQTDFFEVPPMIMQPYVENAIWHGLNNKTEKGVLKILVSKEMGFIKCVITDNGVGRKKAAEIELQRSPKRRSYGMSISHKRIELLKNENIAIPEILVEDLTDENNCPAGTRVSIFIPS